MGTTNNGLHYPEAGDLVRDYPAVQRASQKAIDARISELDEGLQPVRAATDAREGGTLVKRRRDGGSNHQSLWVAEVPKNTGSVTHKGYVDDADAATLAAAKDHANDLPAAAPYYRGEVTDSDSLNDLPSGAYWVHTSSAAESLGLPALLRGSLIVTRFDSENAVVEYTSRSTPPIRYFTTQFSDSWREWEQVSTDTPNGGGGGGWTPPPWTDGTPGTDVTAGTNRYVRIRDNRDGTATIALNVLSQSWTDMDAGTLRTLATFPRGAANLPPDSYAPLAIRAFDLDYATVDEVLSVAISRPLKGSSPIEIRLLQPPSRVFMNAPMVGILTVPTT